MFCVQVHTLPWDVRPVLFQCCLGIEHNCTVVHWNTFICTEGPVFAVFLQLNKRRGSTAAAENGSESNLTASPPHNFCML